ncbi:hypothetical protein [Colwellia psychrerythraea]|uniref:Uncharacterized protein n=1 Tax=Colwellia psychrerythraea TaxID=28229 RepID=A0A099KME0_COLPS|nr:hypothetical protein [Colwellia psychrerythraea]KGJ91934.1 hypothetical protein GAB14E_3091 [Colwellia psychrerythraea]
MLKSKIIVAYRIISVLILSIPTAINIYVQGDIVNSIVAVPLITLGLSGIAIFIDGKLESLLNREELLSAFKIPVLNIYLKLPTIAWYIKSVN